MVVLFQSKPIHYNNFNGCCGCFHFIVLQIYKSIDNLFFYHFQQVDLLETVNMQTKRNIIQLYGNMQLPYVI